MPALAEADGTVGSDTAQNIATTSATPDTQPPPAATNPSPVPVTDSTLNGPDAAPASGLIRASYAAPDTVDATDARSLDTGDLWQRIRNGFALKQLDSPLVATHVDWYAQRPDYLRRTIARSKLYLFHIMEEVQKRGMPAEIALLPIVESAFNPMAYSRSHASGIWQFIPSTGKDFGLKQNSWYDGRRDIVAATDAALDYLDKLHTMFGTWNLALAAYNCGEGCVSRAIAKNQAQGLPTNYLSLSLPAETRHYVPKLMAVKEIISDPGMVGLSLDSIPNQAYFVSVSLHQSIDVKLAAKLADMPVKEFKSLNPAFTKPVVRSDSAQPILLPVDRAEAFSDNLKNYDRPLVSWQLYPAKKGERAVAIAKKFGVTVAWLKQHNEFKLTRKGRLAANYSLMLPLGNKVDTALAAAPTKSPAAVRHTTRTVKVKRGDTLAALARHHGVSIAEIKRWNRLRGEHLRAGSQLIVAEADSVAHHNETTHKVSAHHAKARHYTVKHGDSLSGIAKKFDVSVEDIQHWNSIKHHTVIKPGTRLVLN
ncbi:LysM peptidoglycan-binding domain-containing protein [Sulfuriferula plumbiphila]|uniref:LysM peptidoglycan-binding domain-containing protein n=1 Tax=Sulfuriferula plumbiphila TaxID=171865 RepID=UPI00138708E1|nr:LysM peptidoglycan-binding domain-containing protein [Sulfuriferula plumbiphila]